MRKFFSYLGGFLFIFIVLLKCTGNEHVFRAVRYTYLSGYSGPTINDKYLFDYRLVRPGKLKPIGFSSSYNYFELDTTIYKKIKEYDPTALIVLKGEGIIFEKYWHGYDDASVTNSFSVAKSVVGLAVLKAVEQGFITSLDQKVIDFIPELEGEYREEVSIRHLLSMTSGIDFDESYGNPFGYMAKAYYGENLMEETLSFEAEDEPGTEWKYLGGNTVLLSEIVRRASDTTLSDFVSKYIWKEIGAPLNAFWNLDDTNGVEKAYCCFYATLREFARIGLILVDSGRVLNKQVFSPSLLGELRKPVVLKNGEIIDHYGLHWWLINYNGVDIVYARGILGQYIISVPRYDMVLVRLGNERGETNKDNHPEDLYLFLELMRSFYDQSRLTILD